MIRLMSIFFILVASQITACSDNGEQKPLGILLIFQESEPGVDPYPTRVLINQAFVRFDDGDEQSSFTLYDRKSKVIYSVEHSARSILKLEPVKSDKQIKRELKMDAKRLQTDEEMPSIKGKQPVHYQLTVNGKTCTDVFAIKGLDEEVVKALSEFRRSLAQFHRTNLDKTPPEMQDECFLAHDIQSPNRVLQFGFPVYMKESNGAQRLLIDYKQEQTFKPSLFDLPEGYRSANR